MLIRLFYRSTCRLLSAFRGCRNRLKKIRTEPVQIPVIIIVERLCISLIIRMVQIMNILMLMSQNSRIGTSQYENTKIRTQIRNTLHIRHYILEQNAAVYVTGFVRHTVDMSALDCRYERVDHFLHRLDLTRHLDTVRIERIIREM